MSAVLNCKKRQQMLQKTAQNQDGLNRMSTLTEWHLVSPDGIHYRFRSLRNWLRENGRELFGVEDDTRQFNNVISGLSRVKKSVLGTLPPGQRPGYTYKGWRVIPVEKDQIK